MLYKKIFWIFSFVICFSLSSLASKSNRELPRFASIKASEANTRKGPGAQYPPVNMYQYKSMPIEIIEEYEQWRHIRDVDGEEGWIHSSILSPRRSIIIKSKEHQLMYKSDSLRSRIVAKLEPYVVCNLQKWNKSWCKVKCQDKVGWVSRNGVWGIYANE